tara:strand:- start:470 stop:964 length:495 start_codon:yes stop_codon:yes gene_type:complete
MAIPGHEFLSANFSNDERTIVESYWTTPDGKETRVEYIEAKDGDPNWENLLTHIDIDSLHEATFKQIKQNRKAFEDEVIEIAKKEGLIYDISSVNSQLYKAIVNTIFSPFDKEKDKEKLFMFKLELFEVPEIRLSKDRDLKAKLRKSSNMIDCIKYATEIVQKS